MDEGPILPFEVRTTYIGDALDMSSRVVLLSRRMQALSL
jgi:hypothetical protein